MIAPYRSRPILEKVGELLWRAADHRIAVGVEALHDVGLLERLVHLGVETRDDRLRQSGRSEEAEPRRRLAERRDDLGHGRHVGKFRIAGRLQHRKNLHLTGLGCCVRIGHRDEHHRNVASDHVLHGRRDAAIGHMLDLHAGGLVEQLAHEMEHRPHARTAVGQLIRMGLGIGDQLLHRVHRQRGMDRETCHGLYCCNKRGEILDRVIRQALHQIGSRHMRSGCCRE